MRFENIEVSGIECIVFNRDARWIQESPEFWRLYSKLNDEGKCVPLDTRVAISHDQMMVRVNALKKDRRFRMWLHYDTLNIVRKTEKTVQIQDNALAAVRKTVENFLTRFARGAPDG
jgi:hypothetical protein